MRKDTLSKQIALNSVILITSIAAYSPGIFALSVFDPSILKASFAIFLGLSEVFAFIYGNSKLMKEPEKVMIEKKDINSLEQIESVLLRYKRSKYFSSLAKTAESQANRCDQSIDRAIAEVKRKFEPGSMSYQKYESVISSAGNALVENIVLIVNRMQFFNEEDYDRLCNYKRDDIPDDIQLEQIKLYQKNMDVIKEGISKNEKLILSIDKLSMELLSMDKDDDTLIDEIEQLTSDLKYYTT